MSTEFYDQRLACLKTDLNAYGIEIVDYINSLYSINNTTTTNVLSSINDSTQRTYDVKSDPFNILSVLKIDLNEIIQESQSRNEINAMYKNEIDECSKLTKVLSTIADLIDKLSECENLINKMSLIPACQLIDQITRGMSQLLSSTDTDIGSGRVCSVVKQENKLLYHRLTSKINRIYKESVQFDYGRIIVYSELRGLLRSEDTILHEPLLLTDTWSSINLCRLNDSIVEEILKNIWIFIMRPLWHEKKAPSMRLNRIDDNCIEFIVDNILQDYKPNSSSSSSSSRDHSLNDSILANPFMNLGACRMPIIHLLDSLNQLFSFMWIHVLCSNKHAAEAIAVRLNAAPIALISTIIESISYQLPKSESELSAYRRSLEVPCRVLETKLYSIGLIHYSSINNNKNNSTDDSIIDHDDNATIGPLTEYIMKLPSIYSDLRRKEIMKLAREVVLSDYHNTMLAAGDALEDDLSSAGDIGDARAVLDQSGSYAIQKLKFESCQVSLASCRLLKLIHDVMKQACLASPQVAHILFQSARDCLELFMAIVPFQFHDVLESIPRMAAVLYNDCIYIAHNCTLITHKYRHDLGKVDEVLQHTVGFADFIPRFRTLGDACISRHIDEQRISLLALVHAVNINTEGDEEDSKSLLVDSLSVRSGGLREGILKGSLKLADKLSSHVIGIRLSTDGTDHSSQCNDYERALLIRKHMEHLSNQWLNVLQDQVYSRLFGFLFDVTIGELMKPLLVAECIDTNAGTEINRIFKAMLQIRTLFPMKDDESINRVCANWKKFLALTDLLEYSLNELADWLPRKKFSSFTGNEMTILIKAMFQDSPMRQGLLASVLEMSS